jgi:hypothetical protein
VCTLSVKMFAPYILLKGVFSLSIGLCSSLSIFLNLQIQEPRSLLDLLTGAAGGVPKDGASC